LIGIGLEMEILTLYDDAILLIDKIFVLQSMVCMQDVSFFWIGKSEKIDEDRDGSI
jgi:hypothetical protein